MINANTLMEVYNFFFKNKLTKEKKNHENRKKEKIEDTLKNLFYQALKTVWSSFRWGWVLREAANITLH